MICHKECRTKIRVIVETYRKRLEMGALTVQCPEEEALSALVTCFGSSFISPRVEQIITFYFYITH